MYVSGAHFFYANSCFFQLFEAEYLEYYSYKNTESIKCERECARRHVNKTNQAGLPERGPRMNGTFTSAAFYQECKHQFVLNFESLRAETRPSPLEQVRRKKTSFALLLLK